MASKRRHALARVDLLLLAVACYTSRLAAAAAASEEDLCGLDCSSVYLEPSFRACMDAITSAPEAGLNTTQAVFPEDAAYNAARRTFNSRTLRSPAAVFYAHATADVAAAVKCAHAWGLQISPAAGRQGFNGAAVQDGYLVIDVSNLTRTSVSGDQQTITVGAGNSNAMLQAAVHDANITEVGVPGGFCSFVGVSGWTLGGGYGLLGRYLGLGCDSVVEMEVVLSNGTVVTANSTSHADLLWASCGGGGGTFAIATSFTFRLSPLPNGGRLTSIKLDYAPEVNSSVAAFMRLQAWLPTMDRRYGWFFTFRTLDQPALELTGIFLGPLEEALQGLQDAGMLEDLDRRTAATPANSDVASRFPFGLKLKALDSYYDVAEQGALTWSEPTNIPVPTFGFRPPWGPESNWTASPANLAFMRDLMRGQKGLHLVGGPSYNVFMASQSRLTGLLPQEAVQEVAQYSRDMWDDCVAGSGASASCTLIVSGHVLGGAYSARPANATAYPHRSKYLIMDATISIPTALTRVVPTSLLATSTQLTDQFLRVLKPFLGSPSAAYVNYQLPAFQGWQVGFFGGNYERLQDIKGRYDPLGLFDKPFTVQGMAAGAR